MLFFDRIREKRIEKKRAAFDRSGILRSFSYSYGNMGEGMSVFVIEENSAGALNFTYKRVSMKDGREIRSDMELPLTTAQKLKALIRQEEIYLWNGFNKSNSVIATGHSFSLKVRFDNYSLTADGMVMTPEGYEEKHEILKNFLEGLVKRYYTEISEV